MSLLSTELEAEHHAIDHAIEDFQRSVAAGAPDPATLRTAFTSLRRHIYVEEEFVFPAMREAGLTMPVFVMVREHAELWTAMASLEELLAAPEPDLAAAQDVCASLLTRLESHNSKEEPVIYPVMAQAMGGEAEAAAVAFLDGGTMPEGWVCEQMR